MADVTGPIDTLPGAIRNPPAGMTCDECGQPAEVRVQGETDSFGCEMYDLCRPCWDAEKKVMVDTSGACDWCGKHADALAPRRDIDEGMCGPVYYVCAACRKRDDEALRREVERWGDDLY